MEQAFSWLLRLFAAHLVGDFLLQPAAWVRQRNTLHHRAPGFWYHISLQALLAEVFTGFDTWWLWSAVFMSHGVIDWWKSHRKDDFLHFAVDQSLHLWTILVLWVIRFPDEAAHLAVQALAVIDNRKIWLVGTALLLVTRPAGFAIGMLTQGFRDQLGDAKDGSLERAGTWIGILERVLIFFFVLIGQYEAIGLLVAAKSIIRLKEGEQKMGEYVLIGTLLSISVAILAGIVVTRCMASTSS
jgi:hypothetical protein